MKILVVEDDAEIRTLIAYFLKKEKYEVEICDNGLDALKLVTKFKPELIVLDLMLPNLDGISFTDMVRTMPEKYGNPFILMLTAKTEVEDVLKGLNIGADDYMKKPFDPRELLLRIKKLLERNDKKEENLLIYRDVEIDKGKYVVKEFNEEVERNAKIRETTSQEEADKAEKVINEVKNSESKEDLDKVLFISLSYRK